MTTPFNYQPIADPKVLAANLRITNWRGERLFPLMLEQFRQSCRNILPCIGASMDRNDCDAAGDVLQIFMGTCRLMGAPRLESTCAYLRHMCLEGMTPPASEWATLAQAVGDYLEFAETYALIVEHKKS